MNLERMMFGKEVAEENDLKIKIEAIKLQHYFICTCILILLAVLGYVTCVFILDPYVSYYFRVNYDDNSSSIKLHYDNLTDSEMKIFGKVFNQLNPLYLEKNRNFIVTNDISKYEGYGDYAGVNIGDGKEIIIEYTPSIDGLRKTLCHEILHTYFKYDIEQKDIGHLIIYDLEQQEVCFKDE